MKRTRYKPLPTPPLPVENRYFYITNPDTSSLESLPHAHERSDDFAKMIRIQSGDKEDVFRLSPVPPTLPIPSLPTPVFLPLKERPDDQNDDERLGGRMLISPYVSRSISSIPIKSNIHRVPSSSSLLSRYDDPMSQSLTHSVLDVHMESCSTSPNPSILGAAIRGRLEPVVSRPPDSRRPSVGPITDSREQEERRERARAQLRELLSDPSPSPDRTVDSSSAKEDSSNIPESTPAMKSPSRSGTLNRSSTVQWASEAAKQPSEPARLLRA